MKYVIAIMLKVDQFSNRPYLLIINTIFISHALSSLIEFAFFTFILITITILIEILMDA